MRKEAKMELDELEAMLRKLPCAPGNFVYVDLWKNAQALYAQKEYSLVCDLCGMVGDRITQLLQEIGK